MSGRHKFSELEAEMPARRRARIKRLAETLSKQMDRDGALSLAILSLLRRHPRGLSRRGIIRGLEVSLPQAIDTGLAVLVEKGLVSVRRSGGPSGEIYLCAASTTSDDKLTAAGQ